MPLAEPPLAAGSLASLPTEPTRGHTLHRVWRHLSADGTLRLDPWWFASAPADPGLGGRYDLSAPMGTCYTATRPVGAVLEALQMRLANLPRAELAVRRRAVIHPPPDAPAAGKLTARRLSGEHGVTAALWAGTDRRLTQAWAAALRRDGWWILYGGIQHDPSGQLRGHALFDHAGAHPPTIGNRWDHDVATLHDDVDLHAQLARYGITVRDLGTLPFVTP